MPNKIYPLRNATIMFLLFRFLSLVQKYTSFHSLANDAPYKHPHQHVHTYVCLHSLIPTLPAQKNCLRLQLRLCWMEKHSTTYHSFFSFHFSVWSVFAVSKRVSRTNSITNVLTNVNKTQQGIYKKRIKQNVW